MLYFHLNLEIKSLDIPAKIRKRVFWQCTHYSECTANMEKCCDSWIQLNMMYSVYYIKKKQTENYIK